jgi:hypothetical protein
MALERKNGSLDARGKFILVAQEIAFAKILAGNDKTLRERGVRRLARWLNARSRGTCGKYVFKLAYPCTSCVNVNASGVTRDIFH